MAESIINYACRVQDKRHGLDPAALVDLVPLLACGLVIAQRQMLLYLLDTEPDWPWNQ